MSSEAEIRCPLCHSHLMLLTTVNFVCTACRTPLTVTLKPTVTAASSRQGVRLLAPGANKIMVIKAVRQLTNLGLAAAKDLVEGVLPVDFHATDEKAYKLALPIFEASGALWQPLAAESNPQSEAAPAPSHGDAPASVVALRSHGPYKLEVIRTICAVSGLGLREAKDICESAPTQFQVVQGHTIASLTRRFTEAGATVEVR